MSKRRILNRHCIERNRSFLTPKKGKYAMQYAILINESLVSFAERNNENQQTYWGAWSAYVQAINEAGIVVSGSGLQGPETATSVIFKGNDKTVHDGPYADTKEQLAGFFIVDVPNIDKALEWAKRCPIMKGGVVEVRPVLLPMQG